MHDRLLCQPFMWYLLRVLERTRLLRLLNMNVRIRLLGRSLRIPVRHGVGLEWLMNNESWANATYGVLLDRFPGVFIDAGVNLGQSLVRLRLLEAERAYLGFEPNPACVEYTHRLLRVNALGDADIIKAALADRDGEVDLLMTRDDVTDPSATIVPGFKGSVTIASRRRVMVVSFGAAERTRPIGRIGILKVDVEGGEREVLLALRTRLENDRPAILLEILPSGMPPLEDRLRRQEDVEALLAGLRYRMLRIHDMGARSHLERMEAPIGTHAEQRLANFVVVPAEREAELFPLLDSAIRQQ